MMRQLIQCIQSTGSRRYCNGYVLVSGRNWSSSTSSNPERKVTILGAAGDVGQPLSMLMKLNPLVSQLFLFDLAATSPLAADCERVNTRAVVVGCEGDKELADALVGSDIVIFPAGVPRKPGMTCDECFNINAAIVKNLCKPIAKYCPNALVNMIDNHVNSTVPIASEVFKKAGTYDPKRLLGVTTLDVLRAQNLYATKTGFPVEEVNVPVVGGHTRKTRLPLFSQAHPQVNLGVQDIITLTERTLDSGSATLSMAYGVATFVDACLKGLNGVPNVVECSFVESTVTELPFFASKVKLGKNGVEEIFRLGTLSEYEQEGLEALKPELLSSIQKGIDFANIN